jgi:hypothetical protein
MKDVKKNVEYHRRATSSKILYLNIGRNLFLSVIQIWTKLKSLLLSANE